MGFLDLTIVMGFFRGLSCKSIQENVIINFVKSKNRGQRKSPAMYISSSVPKVQSKLPRCKAFYFESVFHAETEIVPENPVVSMYAISESYCWQVFKYNFVVSSRVYYVPNRPYNFPLIESKIISASSKISANRFHVTSLLPSTQSPSL
jgi:hypothetical protein